MEKTAYNHGGRLRHTASCADEAIMVVDRQYVAFVDAYGKFDIHTKGGANELNDYVRTLKGMLSNLEHFLDHAGSNDQIGGAK